MISGTGNTVIEAVKVLIEHGVQPSVIILLSLFSTPRGEFSMTGAPDEHGLGQCVSIQTLIVKKIASSTLNLNRILVVYHL